MVAHQIAVLDLRALAVAVVPDQALLPVVHPVVHLALQPVLEIEEEKEVVAKALMLHADMTIRKRKEKRKEKGKGIETRTETVIRKGRRETILFLKKRNKNPGIIFVVKLTLIFLLSFIIN